MPQSEMQPESLSPMLHDVEVELEQRLGEACATRPVRDESTAELMRLEESLLEAARTAKQAVSLRRRLRTMHGDPAVPMPESAATSADAMAEPTLRAGGAASIADALPGGSSRSAAAAARRARAAAKLSTTIASPDPADPADETAATGATGAVNADASATDDVALHGRSLVREFRDAKGVEWRVWPVKPERMSERGSVADQLGEYSDGWLAFEAIDGPQRCRLPHYPSGWHEYPDAALEKLLQQADVVHARRLSASRRATADASGGAEAGDVGGGDDDRQPSQPGA